MHIQESKCQNKSPTHTKLRKHTRP